jgi:glutaredoxin-related protein
MTHAEAVQGRIKYLLDQNPVVLFMKGTADTPKCGFSGRVVAALKELQVCSCVGGRGGAWAAASCWWSEC